MLVLVNGMRVMNIEVSTWKFTGVFLMVSTVTLALAGAMMGVRTPGAGELEQTVTLCPRGNE